MKDKIMITNIIYSENKDFTRIAYLLVGKGRLSDNSICKGYSEVVSYSNGKKAFEEISIDCIGKPLDANFEIRNDYKNPLNTKNILKSIEYNGTIINLV